MKTPFTSILVITLMILIASMQNVASAQTDSTKAIKPDTTAAVKPDTAKPAQPAQPAATTQQETIPTTESKGETGKNEFILYVGMNMNQMDADTYESESEVGYQFGLAYRGGGFFYWQVGLKYNNAIYGMKEKGEKDFVTVPIGSIDIPIAAGINILSATDRLVGLRGFIGAVPAFTIGVTDNDLITKDSVNSFVLYGQIGIAANVAFVIVEVGFNYGFQDMLKDHASPPGQFFINLGCRF
jgi:hypothetical protein